MRHPKLKVYLQHSGERYYREVLSMMQVYLHVYSDLGGLLWPDNRLQEHAREFLRQAKTEGFLDRVMFGSDQMNWPDLAIGPSIDFISSLPFLTDEEKQMILYDNAVRFFGLEYKK